VVFTARAFIPLNKLTAMMANEGFDPTEAG
jgi:hypothetical protein